MKKKEIEQYLKLQIEERYFFQHTSIFLTEKEGGQQSRRKKNF
jgi:hypothetical protein